MEKLKEKWNNLYEFGQSKVEGLVAWLKKLPGTIDELIWTREFLNVRLLRQRSLIVGYVLAYILMRVVLELLSPDLAYKLSLLNFPSQIMSITSLLVAFMIPVAIALIQDLDTNTLIRAVIVRRIVRLQWLIGVIVLTIIGLCLPRGMGIWPWFAPLIILSWVFFIETFLRTYYWLTDEAWQPSKKDARGFAFRSYRSAQLLASWAGRTDDRMWRKVWATPSWPYDFEFHLHTKFFDTIDELLKSPIDNHKAGQAALLMEIYTTNFSVRDEADFRTYGEYLGRLLEINFKFIRAAEELQGKHTRHWSAYALHATIKQIFSNGLNRGEDFQVIKSVDTYVTEHGFKTADLTEKEYRRAADSIRALLRAVFETAAAPPNQQAAYSIAATFDEFEGWSVTVNELRKGDNGLALLIHSTYRDWMLDWLENQQEPVLTIDHVTNQLYPEVDTPLFSLFNWFYSLARFTSSEQEAISLMDEKSVPIGHITHSTAEWTEVVTDTPEASLGKAAASDRQKRIEETIELIALTYRGHLQRVWDLDKLIAACAVETENEQSSRNRHRLGALLVSIQEYFKKEKKSAALSNHTAPKKVQ